MTYSKILGGALFAAALTLAGAANAQIKIALDSPPDLEALWQLCLGPHLQHLSQRARHAGRGVRPRQHRR
jgi:hypothetical protein